jgi:hypothetical protein
VRAVHTKASLTVLQPNVQKPMLVIMLAKVPRPKPKPMLVIMPPQAHVPRPK